MTKVVKKGRSHGLTSTAEHYSKRPTIFIDEARDIFDELLDSFGHPDFAETARKHGFIPPECADTFPMYPMFPVFTGKKTPHITSIPHEWETNLGFTDIMSDTGPTMFETVSRRILESLETISADVKNGDIDMRAASYTVRTLVIACMPFCTPEVAKLISDVGAAYAAAVRTMDIEEEEARVVAVKPVGPTDPEEIIW